MNETPSLPVYLRAESGRLLLRVKLQPRASANGIGEVLGDELRIRVTAPPVDEAANEALVRLLAEVLDCPRSHVQLVRGQTSRHKVVSLTGIEAAIVAARLAAAKK